MFSFLSQLSAELKKPYITRPATKHDAEQLARIQHDTIGGTWGRDGFLYCLAEPVLACHVVEERETQQVVAYSLCHRMREMIDVVSLCVAPSHQRRGMGRELVQTLQGLHGWPRHLRAYVLHDQLQGQDFLRAVGFRLTGARKGCDGLESYQFTWRPFDEGARVIEQVLAGEL